MLIPAALACAGRAGLWLEHAGLVMCTPLHLGRGFGYGNLLHHLSSDERARGGRRGRGGGGGDRGGGHSTFEPALRVSQGNLPMDFLAEIKKKRELFSFKCVQKI